MAVDRGFGLLDVGRERVVLLFDLRVLRHQLVHALGNPIGMAGRAPRLLPALGDKGVSVLLLLVFGECHGSSVDSSCNSLLRSSEMPSLIGSLPRWTPLSHSS